MPEHEALVIREAAPGDCAAVAAMVAELAAFEKAAERCQATPEAVRAALFERREARALVAIAPGSAEPVAMAVYFFNFSTWRSRKGLYLEDLYVRPAARGQGVGTAMMRRLAAIAVAQGCARFDWSVLAWNAPAIAFYEKRLGAEVLPDWRICRLEGEGLAALAAASDQTRETL
ncbi:MAG: GNAT family N-acetyltransferase [Duodenibacillus sp.]|nr:GNAT family N-acetyltransferase [Duodenibacillus sp.]